MEGQLEGTEILVVQATWTVSVCACVSVGGHEAGH